MLHLLADDRQWVAVLTQEVEDAPDLEGIVVRYQQVAAVQVLSGAQRPAHPVKVLAVKLLLHLVEEGKEGGLRRMVIFVKFVALSKEHFVKKMALCMSLPCLQLKTMI